MSKREGLWTRFRRFWEDPTTPSRRARSGGDERAFTLMYKNLNIGSLILRDGKWLFRYSDDFDPSELRTITEFPDAQKTYVSSELWPFFQMRIPSLRQTAIKDIVEQEKIDVHDEAALLRRFGRRTVANPFELVPSF